MLKFEVFTSDNRDAKSIAEMFNGNIQAYNVGEDEEAFYVTFVSKLSHSTVVRRIAGYEWEEIISSEI